MLLAEVIAHYYPKLVQLHNYSSANSLSQKAYNWKTINSKVLRRLGFSLSQDEIESLINCVPGTVETLLKTTKRKLAEFRSRPSAGHGPPQTARGAAVGSPAPNASPAPAQRVEQPPPRAVHQNYQHNSAKGAIVGRTGVRDSMDG